MNNIKRLFDDILVDREKLHRAIFKRPESLSSFLPYDEFIEEKNVFLMKDGSFGAIFEIDLLEHESMTEKEIVSCVKSLRPWFNLGHNCTSQILWEQIEVNSLDERFNHFERSFPKPHPVSQILFSKKLDTLKKTCEKQDQNPLLKRKGYLTIRYFREDIKKKKCSSKERGTIIERETISFLKELKNFERILKNVEKGSRTNLKRIDANALLVILRRFFNPKSSLERNFAKYSPQDSLSDQFIYSTPKLNFKGIEREGLKTRTITLKSSPSFLYSGGMSYFLKVLFPFKMTISFSFPTKDKVKRFFDLKEFFLENSPSAKSRVQKEEVLTIQDKLARDDSCLHMTFSVIVEGKDDEELEERIREITSIFQNDLECETVTEDHIGLAICLNSLPLNYTPDADFSTQRFIRILKSDAVKLLPVFDSFRGLKEPLSIFRSRENNIIPFSLLENSTSQHTCVLADTGSGKSALIIDLLQSAKRMNPEPLVFVIDKKSSYTMLSEFFEGELTIFNQNKEMPFSPFRGAYDEEKVAFLTKLIMSAIHLTSPSYVLESEHQAFITKAIRESYSAKCKRAGLEFLDGSLRSSVANVEVNLTMDDVVAEFSMLIKEDDEISREIITSLISKLRPFYADGLYAKFFRGSGKRAKTSNKFFAYDLDALDSDSTLQSLLTMSVIEEIRQTISLPENRERTGFIVFEEFSMLGRNNPMLRDFAIDFAETMRKKGYWLITLTPRPQNYFKSEVGEAFWGVASNFLIMQMTPDSADFLAKHSSMFSEADIEIIKSLRTKNGEYADVYYMNKEGSKKGAFRFVQTEYDRWLSPTNPRDAMLADKAINSFENKWDALDFLVKNHSHKKVVKEKEVIL